MVSAASFNGKQSVVYGEAFLREWYWQPQAGRCAVKRLRLTEASFHLVEYRWLFWMLRTAFESKLPISVEILQRFAREYQGPFGGFGGNEWDLRYLLLCEGDVGVPRNIDDLAWAIAELARRRRVARKACETADYILNEPIFPGEPVEEESWRSEHRQRF